MDILALGAALSLFKKPYFSRVWVQQEIAESELYEIVLQCERISMPWIGLENTAFVFANARFVMDAKLYDDTPTSDSRASLMQLVPSAMSGVAGLERFCTANREPVNCTLYSFLKTIRGYQATDPRDMIFSLVGMQYDSQDSALFPTMLELRKNWRLWYNFMVEKYGISILCAAGLPNRALDPLSS